MIPHQTLSPVAQTEETYISEMIEAPGVVLAREVAGKVSRGDIGDCFSVDIDRLEQTD